MLETAVFGFYHRARAQAPEPELQVEAVIPKEPLASQPAEPLVEAVRVIVAEPTTAAAEASPQPAPRPILPIDMAATGSAEAAADQIGIADQASINLVVTLPASQPVALDAHQAGLYLPAVRDQADATAQTSVAAQSGLAAGTRVLTSRGEIEVEAIDPGDLVLALRGPSLLSVRWIGTGHAAETPVWIEAGALGRDLPRRPLCVGPDQPIFIDPNPVLARTLVNGGTIRHLEEPRPLFLIDVGLPDVLFAEGVPLSSGDRARHTHPLA